MKLLANENFPLASVQFIENKGYDIIHIGNEFTGITDKEVINLATAENRTILTFDSDYGELIFKYNYRPRAGIIYLRLPTYTPRQPGKLILSLVQTSNFDTTNKLTVVTKSKIRQRKY